MSQRSLVYTVESLREPCAICLGKCENKSFPKSCLHGFCYTCLLEWAKVKPECPLCVKPFSSVIHNIKSINEYDEFTIEIVGQEEVLISEFSEPDDDDSSWSDTSSDSSWYTISDTSSAEDDFSEQPNSYSQQSMRQREIRFFRPWRESSSDESSWDTINSESDFGDDIPVLHDIFSRQLFLSEQSLERLDAFLLSFHSDLAASHVDPSGSNAIQPRPNIIGRISVVIEEGQNSHDLTEPSNVQKALCEIVYRRLQDASPSDEENVNIESETDLAP